MVIMFVRKEFRTGVAKTFGTRLRRFDFQPRFRPKQICPMINFLWQANERFSLLSNDPGKMDSNFFCYAATVLSPHRKLLIITERMHQPT